MNLTKDECIQAITRFYENSQNDLKDCDLLSRLIEEYFALIDLFGLNKDYEKAEVEDQEQLNKSIEDNHKMWEQAANLFNEERKKYLQNQIDLMEKRIRKQVEDE